jgi:hypothetical protein
VSRGRLARCSPALFVFFRLCWRVARELMPSFPIVRVLVDPVKQLFTARLLVLDGWGFLGLSR